MRSLIVDANEAWIEADLERHLAACAEAGVALVEQPLPAAHDAALAKIQRIVPICADESVHTRDGLESLRERYDAINVKLDKAGGLTEALAMVKQAERLGFSLVAGCMVGTSLAMAPSAADCGKRPLRRSRRTSIVGARPGQMVSFSKGRSSIRLPPPFGARA